MHSLQTVIDCSVKMSRNILQGWVNNIALDQCVIHKKSLSVVL